MTRMVTPEGDLPFDLSSGPTGSVLDYPGLLADNILRGQILNMGIRPSEMSPQDRATIADRVKAQLGDYPLVGAITEIALNPWVWLAVGASAIFPVGRVAVTETFDRVVTKSLATVRENQPFLGMLGLLTAQLDLAGTDLLPTLNKITKDMARLTETAEEVSDLKFQLLRRLRETSHPRAASLEDVPDLNRKIQAYLHGLHRQRVEPRFIKKTLDDGTGTFGVKEETVEAILDGRKLIRDLERYGAMPYVNALRKNYDDVMDLMFKTDGVVDEDKVLRTVRGMLRDLDGNEIATLKGTPLDHLFGYDMMKAIDEGKITEGQFREYVRKSVQQKSYYAPLNTSVIYEGTEAGGRIVPPDRLGDVFDRLQRVRVATGKYGPAFERTPGLGNMYDPDELLSLRSIGNKNFEKALEDSRKAKRSRANATKSGGVFGMPSLNAERAHAKYVRTSAANYALHVVQPDEYIIEAQRKSRDLIKKAKDEGLRKADLPEGRYYDRTVKDPTTGQAAKLTRPKRSVMEPAELVAGADAPPGGYSMYDVLRAGYQTISDKRTQQILRDSYVPMVLGQVSVKRGAMTSAYSWVKGKFQTLLESPIGDAIRDGSTWGKDFYNAGLQWSKDTNTGPLDVDRGVAGYLYGTTLGMNPYSVAINLLQPLMMLPRYMDLDSVALAYGDAVKEMGTYLSKRLRFIGEKGLTREGLLLGPEHASKKAQLIEESFKWAKEAEIGPSVADTIDKIGAPLNRSARVGALGRVNDVTEFVLKSFEKGEWLNRAVTAHAVARQAAKQGIKTENNPAFLAAITRYVDETQFGSRALNTPRIFMDPNSYAPIFTNPYMRMFLSFPTRVGVGLIEGRKLGGGKYGGGSLMTAITEGDIAPAVLAGRDMMRALGISAVMYEAGKELFGADLTPGTIIGGAEGLVRENAPFSPFPAPPGVTLPVSILQWLSTGDSENIKYSLPAAVPGGVAIARAMSGMPETPLLASGLQRTAVDYSQRTPDGRYRVYDPEGRTISWETLPAILARSSGLDFGKFRNESEMIKFLTSIREQAIMARREYLSAMVRGDARKMARVAKEFKNKFGMELQVNDAQIRAFEQSIETSRVERVLQGMPREFKQQFGTMAAQALGGRLGVDPQRFGEALTIRERNPARYHDVDVESMVPPEVRRGPQGPGQQAPFAPFTPFGR